MISAAMLCLQTALVFATGQAWIYLLHFPLAKLVLSLLSARPRRPDSRRSRGRPPR